MKMCPLAFQSLARWAGSHNDLETIAAEGMGMLLASVLTASEVLNGDNETGVLPCFNAPEVGKIYSSLCFCMSKALACAQERRPLSDIPEAIQQCMEDTLSSPAAVNTIDSGLQTLLMLQSFSWCYKEGDDLIGYLHQLVPHFMFVSTFSYLCITSESSLLKPALKMLVVTAYGFNYDTFLFRTLMQRIPWGTSMGS